MNVINHIISPQNNAPIVGVVQDTLLGIFILSRIDTKVPLNIFYDCIFATFRDNRFDIQEFFGRAYKYYKDEFIKVKRNTKVYFRPKNTLANSKIPVLSGRILISTIFPKNFSYECKSESTVNKSIYDKNNDGMVRIENGIILPNSEVLCKKSIGGKANSVIHILALEYGNQVAGRFISEIQFLNHAWFHTYGFSMGIEDCLAVNDKEIRETLIKGDLECQRINESSMDKETKEREINTTLNNVRNVGQRLSKNGMKKGRNNALYCMTGSGAKGSYVNIASILACLGQQNIEGKRMEMNISNNRRTLYTFEYGDNSPEARGFVSSSFINGLSPTEFFFHGAGAREGIIDTSIKTSTSGYLQRKIVKKLEDCKILTDGTVRNANGDVIWFNYGGDSFDASKLYYVNNQLSFIDVKRLANRMNVDYENEI